MSTFWGTVQFYFASSTDETLIDLAIKSAVIEVELAMSDVKKQLGLSGRSNLPEDKGMLFVYDKPNFYSFWMKDMLFPIDIIWIAPTRDTSSSGGGETLRIVDLEQYIQPDTFPHVFYPKRNALYVLEVSAGFTEIHGIEVGDQVRL